MAAYIVVLVMVYVRFFYHRHNGFMLFVKNVLLPITVVGGWVVYFTGYHLGSEIEHNFFTVLTHGLLALFSAGRLFVLGNDLVEVSHQVKENMNWLLWFSLVGAMAVFLSVSILLHVFGKRLITRIRIWIKVSKENHIFFGVNEASISLAKDLIQNDRGRLVVFIKKLDFREDANLYQSVEETGAMVINNESFLETISLKSEESIFGVHRESSDPIILNKLKLIRKISRCPSHLYILSEREEWNMSIARSILNESDTLKMSHTLTFHIRISGADLEEPFYKSLPPPLPNVRIRLLNYSDVAARQLIALHNPADWIGKDTSKALATTDFNVMIVGFDQIGNAALRKLVEYGQFAGSHFSATVTDKNIEIKKGRFRNSFPGLISEYKMEFHEAEAGCSYFFDLVKEKMDTLDYIVITLGDDTLNIQTAIDIREVLVKNSVKRMKIIAQVKNNEHFRHLFDITEGISINVFGRVHDIFTEDIVVRGKLEAMAVRIHDYYNTMKPPEKQRGWEQLTRMEQASNVSAADHIYTKLTMTKLRPADIRQLESQVTYESMLGEERIENLARGEHLHWNAMLFSHGWARWNLSDIPAGSKSNKDNIRKLHACLVDWDELAAVEERFREDYYKYDYDIIQNIYKLIKEGVYSADV